MGGNDTSNSTINLVQIESAGDVESSELDDDFGSGEPDDDFGSGELDDDFGSGELDDDFGSGELDGITNSIAGDGLTINGANVSIVTINAASGLWAGWSTWSACSVTCGGGEMTRTRGCNDVNGCVGQNTQGRPCATGLCVDGKNKLCCQQTFVKPKD